MAQILMSGATGILKKLVGVVFEDIGSAFGVKDDLKKLQSTSEMILAVIADAEKRQEKEEVVRLWLRKLKGIAYDADDVIDEFSYEDMRRCDTKDRLKRKVLNFASSSSLPFTFRLKMAKQIKDINKRLEEITQQMGSLRLESTTPNPDGETTLQLDREFTSHVNESEIVGRENDESHIIKLLTTHIASSSSSSSSSTSSENISVISIVGMGGLGKTTLAQLVYKDEWVNKVFEIKMWVHVSEIFDIEIILVKLMESITQTKFHRLSNFRVLVNKVQEKLNGKKYLLVLDDLWNEDSEQWGILMSVLLASGPGSKILITTRNHQVASVVGGSIPPYNLDPLPDDACWSIIEKKAFSPGGALNDPQMSDIGKQIAKKCCGLPLSAKFLRGLMHLKNKQSDWISVRDDDIWNTSKSKTKILPVLKLSYNNLPSHLKQCFSYCSIFPKNWEIRKETLVHLWMAEGFLKQSNIRNKRSIEDFGRDYFESLAWSSFFQDFKKNELGNIETCKMHDLVHDLAQDVLGENEIMSLKASKLTDVSKIYRLHLDLDEHISTTFLKSLSDAKMLRTLFIPEGSDLDPSIFSENNLLRILHVGSSPTPSLLKLSSLRVKLKHLRYLRLTLLDLREIEDDHSINKLYNLETLVLSRIAGVQSILTNIQSLQKLRYLEVSWTDMIEQLPVSITSLSNLQTLDLNNNGFLKVIPDSISSLKNLRFLNLSFNPIEELPVSITTLSNLQTLDVNTCKSLKALPEYVASLANLEIFNFKNCPLLEALPKDFGSLTQLRFIDLEGTQIRVLQEACTNLNNLEYVDLGECELPKEVTNWIKLRQFYHRETLMGIRKLAFLQTLTYKVREKVMNEAECNDGIEELANLNFLEVLAIGGLQNVKDSIDAERANLKSKHYLPQLALVWKEVEEEELGMIWDQKSCNHLQVFEALQPPAGLRTLGIHNFLGSGLPSWMCVPDTLMNLDILVLKNCKEIKQLPASIGQLSRLKHLDLTGIPLKRLDMDGFPSLIELHLNDMLHLEELCYSYPCLQDLRIRGCKRLTEIPSFPSLKVLLLKNKIDPKLVCSVGRSQTSLTGLWLNYVEDLIYFPISILQNNFNLQTLHILKCGLFQGFRVTDDENENVVALYGPEHFSVSLQKLKIYDFPALKCLPDLRGWTSLRELVIFNCPQLKESFTYDLRELSFLARLLVDFLQRDMLLGDPSGPAELINLVELYSYLRLQS